MPDRPVKLLIVDDSALVRKRLSESLAKDPEIEVVGTAVDPFIARDKILKLNPDVLTLDIEMPRMDGLTFLKRVMKFRPMPVIIISSITQEGSNLAMEALRCGAVDVLAKSGDWCSTFDDMRLLAEKVKAAARARVANLPLTGDEQESPSSGEDKTTLDAMGAPAIPAAPFRTTISNRVIPPARSTAKPMSGISGRPRPISPRQLIVLGASTGGTEAIRELLSQLPADIPGICIVQHIPAYFSAAFAKRLNEVCSFEVREAKHGDMVRPGLALVAPGGQHMILKWNLTHYRVELTEGPAIHHQRPSVDVLFDSAVKAGAGAQTLGILLTGMGADGADGLLKLRKAGAETIAQNEETCVVYGMPREAVRLGAARHVLALDKMALFIDRFADGAMGAGCEAK
jgi:two-component system chemotaxis response regulator CheB